jgi:hypothetical protein
MGPTGASATSCKRACNLYHPKDRHPTVLAYFAIVPSHQPKSNLQNNPLSTDIPNQEATSDRIVLHVSSVGLVPIKRKRSHRSCLRPCLWRAALVGRRRSSPCAAILELLVVGRPRIARCRQSTNCSSPAVARHPVSAQSHEPRRRGC